MDCTTIRLEDQKVTLVLIFPKLEDFSILQF